MIVLYNPISSQNRKPVLPMSLLSLGGLLEDRHRYEIVDGNLDGNPLVTIEKLFVEDAFPILGVTVMPGPQLVDAAALCRILKKKNPRLTVVWGGYFPTQHPDVCLRSGYVDYVVRGHGELVFRDLVDAVSNGRRTAGVQGLACADPATGSICSGELSAIPQLDDLPDFPYHRLPMQRYLRRTFLGSRTISHHSSYGCPFTCNFCAVVNMVNGRWIAQSASRTASVVERLTREFGANAVEFYDNNFFVHEDRVAEFAERVARFDICWWGEARIDTLLKFSENSWRRMAGSGLKMVFMGAESASDSSLRAMNKGGTACADKTLEIAALMKTQGIIPEFSFIVGTPPDPEADTLETIEFIRRVKRVNPEAEIILYPYTPVALPGTLYDRAQASGFTFPEDLDEWTSPPWQRFSKREWTRLPWLPSSVRHHILDFTRVLNAFYPTSTDPNLGHGAKRLLRLASGWRYASRYYRHPYELRLLDRLIHYQRPETSGF